MKDEEFMRKHIDALNKIDKEFEKLNKNIEEANVYLSQIAKYCVNKYDEEHKEEDPVHTNPEDSIRAEDDSIRAADRVAYIKYDFYSQTLVCSKCGADIGLRGFDYPTKCPKCGRIFVGTEATL